MATLVMESSVSTTLRSILRVISAKPAELPSRVIQTITLGTWLLDFPRVLNNVVIYQKKIISMLMSTARGNTTNYWILDTDYTTYTVVYDCRPAFDDITEYKWILTRDPVPDQATVSCIYRSL